MSIGIFRRPYIIRRHGEQKIVNGHAVSGSTEFTAQLNVQPLSANELLALPEGERTVKRVKTYGATALISADEHSQTPGDRMYYDGAWYECKTCVHWLHTPLTHYEAEFVIHADQSTEKPPGGDANDD
jgi:hypothetical protein